MNFFLEVYNKHNTGLTFLELNLPSLTPPPLLYTITRSLAQSPFLYAITRSLAQSPVLYPIARSLALSRSLYPQSFFTPLPCSLAKSPFLYPQSPVRLLTHHRFFTPSPFL